MAFCTKCGVEAPKDVKFCASCGNAIDAEAAQTVTVSEDKDAQDNKGMGILAYILFFIPLLKGAHKTSPFVKYHTNQGTVLFILAMAYAIVEEILRSMIKVPTSFYGVVSFPETPGWLNLILSLGNLAIFVLFIMGIVNVVNGKKVPLPLIGGYTIIK